MNRLICLAIIHFEFHTNKIMMNILCECAHSRINPFDLDSSSISISIEHEHEHRAKKKKEREKNQQSEQQRQPSPHR